MSPGRDTEAHAAYAAGGTFNTGILFIRANAQGKAFARAWHANVAQPARGTRFFSDTSDQQVFNHMMRDPSFWPGISAPQGEHVMKTFFDKEAGQAAGAQPNPGPDPSPIANPNPNPNPNPNLNPNPNPSPNHNPQSAGSAPPLLRLRSAALKLRDLQRRVAGGLGFGFGFGFGLGLGSGSGSG